MLDRSYQYGLGAIPSAVECALLGIKRSKLECHSHVSKGVYSKLCRDKLRVSGAVGVIKDSQDWVFVDVTIGINVTIYPQTRKAKPHWANYGIRELPNAGGAASWNLGPSADLTWKDKDEVTWLVVCLMMQTLSVWILRRVLTSNIFTRRRHTKFRGIRLNLPVRVKLLINRQIYP